MVDHVTGLTGLASIVEFGLLPLNLKGITNPLAGGIMAGLNGIIKVTPIGAYLSAQLLVLCALLDRIQALSKPAAYLAHNSRRRCIMANLVAYGLGIIPPALTAFATHYTYLYPCVYNRLAITNITKVENGMDYTCFNKPAQLNSLNSSSIACDHYDKYSSEAKRWLLGQFLYSPSVLCPGRYHASIDQIELVIMVTFLSALATDLIAAVAGVILNAVTVSVLAEAMLMIVGAAINVATWASNISSADGAIITAGIICVQIGFGSYMITFVTFKTFRSVYLENCLVSWVPKPQALFTLLFAYTGVGVLVAAVLSLGTL